MLLVPGVLVVQVIVICVLVSGVGLLVVIAVMVTGQVGLPWVGAGFPFLFCVS